MSSMVFAHHVDQNPQGKPIRSVTINGQASVPFAAGPELSEIVQPSGAIQVEAQY